MRFRLRLKVPKRARLTSIKDYQLGSLHLLGASIVSSGLSTDQTPWVLLFTLFSQPSQVHKASCLFAPLSESVVWHWLDFSFAITEENKRFLLRCHHVKSLIVNSTGRSRSAGVFDDYAGALVKLESHVLLTRFNFGCILLREWLGALDCFRCMIGEHLANW